MRHARHLLFVLGLALGAGGCTITPARVDGSASYDGAEANSGVLSLEKTGAVVTPRVVERYVALLDLYRTAFVPRVNPTDGVAKRPDGTCFITNEVLERLILMAEWRRMGRKPD